jgi:hypothetical protein
LGEVASFSASGEGWKAFSAVGVGAALKSFFRKLIFYTSV